MGQSEAVNCRTGNTMAKRKSNDKKIPLHIKLRCPFIRLFNKSNTTGATSGAECAYLSGELEFTSDFNGVRVAQSYICLQSIPYSLALMN